MSLPLLRLLTDPGSARGWGVSEWEDTLPRLAQSGIMSHAAALAARAGFGRDDVPPAVRRQFAAASIASIAQLRSLRWETNEAVRVLRQQGIRAIALKGADYLLRDATCALGRTVNDLDLLISRDQVEAARDAFEAAGWDSSAETVLKGNHQLPLLTHGQRQTQLELHFQLVAEGGAVGFDVTSLFRDSVPLPDGVLAMLSPEDTTLVCAAHFIRNSRPFSAFRDLLDLRELVADFTARDVGFGNSLVARAEQVGLGPALSRAVRDSSEIFGGIASPELASWAKHRRPSLSGGSAMALVPDGSTTPSLGMRMSRVGRMFARMRSAYPPGKTLQVGLKVLQGKSE